MCRILLTNQIDKQFKLNQFWQQIAQNIVYRIAYRILHLLYFITLFLSFFPVCSIYCLKLTQYTVNYSILVQTIYKQQIKSEIYIIYSLHQLMSTITTQQPGINDLIKGLPVKERVPVVALRKLMTQRQQIDEEQEQSIAKIKVQYQNKLRPLLQRASQIIQGNSLKPEELKGAQQFMKSNQNLNNYLKGKVIDNYWGSVLSNSPLVDQISQNDQKALNFLIDIQNIYAQNTSENSNVSLKFIFKQNPYFNETIIIRNLRIQNGQVLALDGDQITWKQNKWLTHQKKKITNKKTGESKIQKGKKIKSFFDIFLDWNVDNQVQLQKVSTLMIQLGNMIVMDSLDYFLGLINVDDYSQEDQQQEDEDDDEPQGQKKVKQN